MTLTEIERIMQHRLFQQLRDDTMKLVIRRLDFKNRKDYIDSDLIEDFEVILKSYRKQAISIADYGDFDYGTAYHRFSGMLNGIICYIEEVLKVPTLQWYQGIDKRLGIDAYRMELDDLKKALLEIEKYHHTYVPLGERKSPKYAD